MSIFIFEPSEGMRQRMCNALMNGEYHQLISADSVDHLDLLSGDPPSVAGRLRACRDPTQVEAAAALLVSERQPHIALRDARQPAGQAHPC